MTRSVKADELLKRVQKKNCSLLDYVRHLSSSSLKIYKKTIEEIVEEFPNDLAQEIKSTVQNKLKQKSQSPEKPYNKLMEFLCKSTHNYDEVYLPTRDYHMGLLMMLAPLSVKDIRNIESIDFKDKTTFILMTVKFQDGSERRFSLNKYLDLFRKVYKQYSEVDQAKSLKNKLKSYPNYPFELYKSFERDIVEIKNFNSFSKIRNFYRKDYYIDELM